MEFYSILQCRAFNKLSNAYLFATNGFVNLWEFEFENHIGNNFELIRKGG
jgi:hypothetical protein